MELDDFIKYAKENFGCQVSVEKSENPDTFDKIFGDVDEDNCMEISKNAIENMILAYIDHKQILIEYESEMDEQEMEEDANYNFHRGCCETAECWMRAIGVSPDCEFIREKDCRSAVEGGSSCYLCCQFRP